MREPAAAGPELLVTPPPASQGSGYLGIKADDRGPGDGIRVVEVMAGSPADTGGLIPGDLITAVQSKAVHSVEDFAGLLGRMSVGTNVTFDVLRDNERHSVDVTLGASNWCRPCRNCDWDPCRLSRPKPSAPRRKWVARRRWAFAWKSSATRRDGQEIFPPIAVCA